MTDREYILKEQSSLPRHVAVIMDGNGRWARKRGLQRVRGHEKGYRALKRFIEANRDIGVPYISVYAFSTENWTRPGSEVKFLMGLALQLVKEYLPTLLENDIRLLISGSRKELSADLLAMLDDAVAKTAHCGSYTLNIAFNYGGRKEILDAAVKIARDAANEPDLLVRLDNKLFQQYLYHPEVPDVDLVIRTSGEYRISNFLIWQAAYAEYWFTKKLWPDFGRADYYRALRTFMTRKRRFGGLDSPEQ